jgi:periodic tryptophan protein 1
VITTESGVVLGFDTRNTEAPVFEFKAHEKACSSVSFSPHIPNMMATCSVDEYIKIWDIAHNGGTEPKLIGNKKTNMGELFTLSYYKDIPWVLAAGGSKGELAVWDTEENENLSKHFTPFIDPTKVAGKVVESDSDDEESKGDDDSSSDDDGIAKKKKQKKQDKAGTRTQKKQ